MENSNLLAASTDPLSRLAAVGESLYTRRITPEDETDRLEVSTRLSLQRSLQQHHESMSGDVSDVRTATDGPSVFSPQATGASTANSGRFSAHSHELQLIEVERRKLLGFEDELILQDHLLTHENILLQKKVEESALFAIRQMRLFTKDELSARFYDLEKIINQHSNNPTANLNDSSGVRSMLHRILVDETMPLTWSNSRYPSNRDTNTSNEPLNRLDMMLKDSSLWMDRAASSSSSNNAQRSSISNMDQSLVTALPSRSERIALESMIHEMPRKRNFQEDVELQNEHSQDVMLDISQGFTKRPRLDIPEESHNVNVSDRNLGAT